MTKPEVEQPKTKHHKLTNQQWLQLIIAVLVIFSIFMFTQYNDAKNKLKNSSPAANTSQVNSLIASVRKLVVVPANETPTVATVSNVNNLKSQTFFTNAKNGDKVLVYTQQKEAILYRPSTNQIVNISSVSLSSNSSN